MACQKVIWRQPKMDGSSQFHSCSTTSPPMAINSSIARIANGARKIHFLLMFSSSCFRKFVVNVLQSLAQMQHRIAFAGEQCIHAHASLGGHLLETAPFQLVRNKHLALLLRQLVNCQLEFIKNHVARVEHL